MFTRSDNLILDYFREENIGVDCVPRCGNCQCGHCAFGGKRMSLQNERKYEVFKSNLTYDPVGTVTDPGPYWKSKLPRVVDKGVLGDNKKAVLGTMNATAKRLGKDLGGAHTTNS